MTELVAPIVGVAVGALAIGLALLAARRIVAAGKDLMYTPAIRPR